MRYSFCKSSNILRLYWLIELLRCWNLSSTELLWTFIEIVSISPDHRLILFSAHLNDVKLSQLDRSELDAQPTSSSSVKTVICWQWHVSWAASKDTLWSAANHLAKTHQEIRDCWQGNQVLFAHRLSRVGLSKMKLSSKESRFHLISTCYHW